MRTVTNTVKLKRVTVQCCASTRGDMRARASMVIYRCGVHGNAGSPPRSRAELTGLEGEHQTEEQQSLHGSAESVIGSELREDRMKKRDFSDSDSNLTHRRNPPPLSPLPGCARATLHHFTAFFPQSASFFAPRSVFYYTLNRKARGHECHSSALNFQNKS